RRSWQGLQLVHCRWLSAPARRSLADPPGEGTLTALFRHCAQALALNPAIKRKRHRERGGGILPTPPNRMAEDHSTAPSLGPLRAGNTLAAVRKIGLACRIVGAKASSAICDGVRRSPICSPVCGPI